MFKNNITSVAITSPMLVLFTVNAHGFCTHGNREVVELGGYKTQVTRLYEGDFNGDGVKDQFCKDVRKDGSNQNRLLEWIKDGKTGQVRQLGWSEWCTHRNSKIRVITKTPGGDTLECTDNISENRWTRRLKW